MTLARINNENPVLDRLHSLLGEAVLLPIPLKTKKPIIVGWQNLTDSEALHSALLAAVRQGGNIGVLLGPASNRLLALDLDDDGLVDEWLSRHPWLTNTLRTKGKRGCQFWLRLENECDYPNGKAVYKLVDSQTGNAFGELRLGGGEKGAQSVIYGVHPEGMQYQIQVDKPPIEVSLADLDELAPGAFLHNRETSGPAPVAGRSIIQGIDRNGLE